MPDRIPRRRLELLPAGGVALPLLSMLGKAVDAALGTMHRVVPPLSIDPAWMAGDGVRSGAVLDTLLARADPAADGRGGALLLVVTEDALVGGDGGTVFGEAAIGGGCAVIGLGALDGGSDCGEKTLVERASKTAVHEAAHAVGLEHCADPTCVMYPGSDIADLDRKAIGFCTRCSTDLAHATLDATRG